MTAIRRVTAVAALLLGLLGLAASLTGIYALWQFGARIDRATTRALDQADSLALQVNQRVGQAREQLGNSRKAALEWVGAFEAWRTTRDDGDRDPQLNWPDVESTLAVPLERAADWVQLASAAGEVLDPLLASPPLGNAPGEGPGEVKLTQLLQNARESLDRAQEQLSELRQLLGQIREGRDTEANARKVGELVASMAGQMEVVDKGFDTLAGKLESTREKLDDWSHRIQRGFLLGQIVATLVLLWLAAAQLSLAVHGWKWLRARK